MDKKTLTTLSGVLILLIVLVFAVDSLMGGLPGSVEALYEQESAEVGSAEATLERSRSQVNGLLEREPDFLSPISEREDWRDRLARAAAELKEAKELLAERARPLMEKNDSEDAQMLQDFLYRIRNGRVHAVKEAVAVTRRADDLVRFKEERPAMVEKAMEDFRAMDPSTLAPLKAQAAQAAADWPEKKADIEERMKVFDTLLTQAAESHAFLAEENKKADDEVDFDKLANHCEALEKARIAFLQSRDSLTDLLGQLFVSWDKILADMEIREGYEVDFYHTYKFIKVNREDKTEEETQVQQVSKEFYLRHENDLGMTLESKPKGLYDFEAVKQTTPPGYTYVGNPHYGKWEHRSGGSFWVFYGQYAFMRDLFWGPSYYHPISRTQWEGYRTAREQGRTYYGRDNTGRSVYGSKGTLARTKYAGSKYSTKGGYAGTQFKKSGGSYRGSRYATKSSRSSSSRSFFSGSRSSRSSGGK
jgi:hypothetical protein